MRGYCVVGTRRGSEVFLCCWGEEGVRCSCVLGVRRGMRCSCVVGVRRG